MLLLTEAHYRLDAAQRLELAHDVRAAMHAPDKKFEGFARELKAAARPKPKRRRV